MFAGASLVLTVLAVSFIGDGLRDAFDPGSSKSKKI
jgi:ABC-type dipeptide/oligopeptide/nickel transport system permease subunit